MANMLRRGERGCEGVVGLDDNGGCMWVYGGGATHETQVSTWRWSWFVRKRRQMVKVQVLERERDWFASGLCFSYHYYFYFVIIWLVLVAIDDKISGIFCFGYLIISLFVGWKRTRKCVNESSMKRMRFHLQISNNIVIICKVWYIICICDCLQICFEYIICGYWIFNFDLFIVII